MRLNHPWVVAVGAGMAWLLSAVFFMCTPTPKIAVVDMTYAIEAPAIKLSASMLTPEQQALWMTRYTHALTGVIADYSKAHGVMVIDAHVLANPNKTDITSTIIKLTVAKTQADSHA